MAVKSKYNPYSLFLDKNLFEARDRFEKALKQINQILKERGLYHHGS